MINRQHNTLIFECDACGATLDPMETGWAEAKREFDDEGWKAHLNVGNGQWEHLCRRCA